MSKHRRAAKRDANEPAIIQALTKVGAVVVAETNIDLYVFYRGGLYAMEVKDKSGRLTPYQQKLHAHILEQTGYEVPKVYSIDQALNIIGATDE